MNSGRSGRSRKSLDAGLWILPPELHTLDFHPWIEIRDSQWKAETANGHHFHFNVNRISRSVASGTLGKQLLPVSFPEGFFYVIYFQSQDLKLTFHNRYLLLAE
jgi:hypothetical protein